jgi:hypothetical protein
VPQHRTRRRYTLQIGIGLIVMLDAFRHSFSRHDAFDYTMLAVGIVVLILTAYQVSSDPLRAWKRSRSTTKLLPYFKQGEELYASVPRQSFEQGPAIEWTKRVEQWTKETNILLEQLSPAASAAFLHITGGITASEDWHRIHAHVYDSYRQLMERLNNLRTILETPEVYL